MRSRYEHSTIKLGGKAIKKDTQKGTPLFGVDTAFIS